MAKTGLLVVLCVVCCAMTTPVGAVVVQTKSGPVRGEVVSGSLRFLGIPYARAPLGPRRFRPPEPPEPWTDVRDATKFGYICMQPWASNLSEDCLTLNINLPGNDLDLDPTQKRAVMVWIHGGGLRAGTASENDIAPLSMRGDVIGVTLNYRLGIFGFLTTGDDEITGNSGFLDQNMALRWVQDNIERFGGDKDRVTIFGVSAGAWSVSAHVLSPMSRSLFRRAISQSGVLATYPAPHYKDEDRRKETLVHASGVGCDVSSTAAMLECLQNMDANELVTRGSRLPGFGAVIDGTFFPKSLQDMWRDFENTDSLDYLAGLNHDEGDLMLELANRQFRTTDLQYGVSDERVWQQIDGTIRGTSVLTTEHRDVVYDQYVSGDVTNMTRVRAVLDVVRDATFLAPTIIGMDAMVASGAPGRAYLYYFEHQTPAGRAAAPATGYRAGHTQELPYLFGDLPQNMGFNNEDREISDVMIEAWSSFAKTGQPLVPLSDNTTLQWPQYDVNRTFLSIQYPMASDRVMTRLLPRATSFWNVLAPAMSALGSGGVGPEEECQEESPSRIGRDEAETALFILVAVVIVLLLITAILTVNYCSLARKKAGAKD